MQCRCPNRGLGCAALIGVLDVEHHLGAECEWREEACDQCHQQVRRAEMARHKDTTCARKPMGCGYADVGCPTRCPQEDLAAHERDGVVHMGLLRQRLADTSADLTQCKADLTQTRHDLTQTQAQLAESRAAQSDTAAALSQTQHDLAQTEAKLTRCEFQLARCQAELAQTREQTQHELAAVRSQIDQEVALEWQPVPCMAAAVAAMPPGPPVRYRVQATLLEDGGDADLNGCGSAVVYTGPECRCRYRLPDDRAEARFAVVAMRGLAESGPSAPATCTRPAHIRPFSSTQHQPTNPAPSPRPPPAVVFRYDHDMDDRGLFYYLGTQGRTQPWQNPAEAGWVTATRSSECGGGEASDALGRQPCHSYTNNRPTPSWWQVDLGAGRLFTPTRYTLRHSNNPSQMELRLQSWRLEGSVDGADGSWRTLDEHTNEPNAIPARADAMATFAVAPERAFPARHFRVLMTVTWSCRAWRCTAPSTPPASVTNPLFFPPFPRKISLSGL
ncbi:hypothetical protein PAPYR_9170 [Paratrimastix pyriformis]|uniref:TRAF-type domain-containing protein n=1 Tax=Paratrimastix pyriformis TaxID=342808 RepID=A0ABQ8UDT1_9EUKA|nr:hypothetical protein PAPYR_9170 [Paratrimastix pyriformis]